MYFDHICCELRPNRQSTSRHLASIVLLFYRAQAALLLQSQQEQLCCGVQISRDMASATISFQPWAAHRTTFLTLMSGVIQQSAERGVDAEG